MQDNSPPDPKEEALRKRGALNPRPERVSDPLFTDNDFFDARDLVQVKYEMLRRERDDGLPVTQAAAQFGFSRVTFYDARQAFESEGIAGLESKKRGPKAGHKLTPEVVTFLVEERGASPDLSVAELAERIEKRFGVCVHARSIERCLAKQKKKQP